VQPGESSAGPRNLLQVYEKYGRWIRARVRRFLRDAWEDGVQEVLLKLQPALGRMRDHREPAMRALVSRTVRSVCIDEIRRRQHRVTEPLAGEGVEDAQASEPEDRLEFPERLRRAWDALPVRERRILKLRFHDGLTFREIAELLDVPLGSVTGWHARAIARLREVMP
jgi:RNA polymerase sigma-70 factor (ECF subfamily)